VALAKMLVRPAALLHGRTHQPSGPRLQGSLEEALRGFTGTSSSSRTTGISSNRIATRVVEVGAATLSTYLGNLRRLPVVGNHGAPDAQEPPRQDAWPAVAAPAGTGPARPAATTARTGGQGHSRAARRRGGPDSRSGGAAGRHRRDAGPTRSSTATAGVPATLPRRGRKRSSKWRGS